MVTSFVIDQVSWHTQTPGNPETREEIVRRFFVIANFLQTNGLTTHDLSCNEADIGDAFRIHSDDLTEEGFAVMKAAYAKWLGKVDHGMPPENVNLLTRALDRVRAG